MRLLIISDNHLTDHFDQQNYDYLTTIIAQADKVVINGDFWDRYLTSFDDFMNSKWSGLFPLLLSKHAVYIYGNHDEEKYSDDRRNLFSEHATHIWETEIDGVKLHFEHGHHISLLSSGDEPGTYAQIFISLESLGRHISNKLVNKILQPLNDKMINWAKTNLQPDQILVCGHTHIQQKAVQVQFLNSGLNCYGFKQFITITDGVIESFDIKQLVELATDQTIQHLLEKQ